ncbi:M48 family metallopeptidase [Selenomonas sp. F0473]|uniref:M48 family metallopeptidase n=1 Tax=Selenomonas sp. F0473 TaxID=999423 RepID=UPI0025E811C2|nr:SprT family zinc-dependent metalloprotease [Selenomonas sp. F0473]
MKRRVRLLREENRTVEGRAVHICYKNIRNLYLRVSPAGMVEVSAPQWMTAREIEEFIGRRRAWIDERLRFIFASAAARGMRRYAAGETILLWGARYPLEIRPITRGKAYAAYENGQIYIYALPDADAEERAAAIRSLYRTELAAAIERETPACERIVGKHAAAWRIRAMKTRWGSCNVRTAHITLNLALARYDRRALVYVILHELTHLWVYGHGAAFRACMDRYLPDWRDMRRALNAWAREDGGLA